MIVPLLVTFPYTSRLKFELKNVIYEPKVPPASIVTSPNNFPR